LKKEYKQEELVASLKDVDMKLKKIHEVAANIHAMPVISQVERAIAAALPPDIIIAKAKKANKDLPYKFKKEGGVYKIAEKAGNTYKNLTGYKITPGAVLVGVLLKGFENNGGYFFKPDDLGESEDFENKITLKIAGKSSSTDLFIYFKANATESEVDELSTKLAAAAAMPAPVLPNLGISEIKRSSQTLIAKSLPHEYRRTGGDYYTIQSKIEPDIPIASILIGVSLGENFLYPYEFDYKQTKGMNFTLVSLSLNMKGEDNQKILAYYVKPGTPPRTIIDYQKQISLAIIKKGGSRKTRKARKSKKSTSRRR